MSFVDSTLDDDISDQKENNDFTDQDRNNDITDQNKSDDFTDHDKSDGMTDKERDSELSYSSALHNSNNGNSSSSSSSSSSNNTDSRRKRIYDDLDKVHEIDLESVRNTIDSVYKSLAKAKEDGTLDTQYGVFLSQKQRLKESDKLIDETVLKNRLKEKPLSDPDFFLKHSTRVIANCFHFDRLEILQLLRLLDFTEFENKHRTKIKNQEGLLLFLSRFACFIPYRDYPSLWGRPSSTVSHTVNDLMNCFYNKYRMMLDFKKNPLLTKERVRFYAKCIEKAGAKEKNVFCFIDEFSYRISKPSHGLDSYWFNSLENIHTCNFLVITAPDGLIIGLYGPFPGSVNDQNAVCETDLLSTLKSRYSFDGIDYCVYGDKDFERQGQLLSEYFVVYLDTDKTKVASNKSMEPLRASIEQVFENIETSFSGALDYRTQLLGKSHFLTSFSVACLLYNFRICLRHRSAAGETFRATPPIFDEYLQYTKS